MVWQGINLSHYHEQKWLKLAIKHLVLLLITLIIGISLAISIWQFNQTQSLQTKQQQKSIINLSQKIQQQKQAISQLKNQQTSNKVTYLEKDDITQFIQDISQLNLGGFIENIHFLKESSPQIKLLGKLFNEEGLDSLIEQFKKKRYLYKLEHFQKDEHHQFEFSLLITLSRKESNHEIQNKTKFN